MSIHCVAAWVNVYVIQRSQGEVYVDLTSCLSIQMVPLATRPQHRTKWAVISGQLRLPFYILLYTRIFKLNMSLLHETAGISGDADLWRHIASLGSRPSPLCAF